MELYKYAPVALLCAACTHTPVKFVYPVSIDMEKCPDIANINIESFEDVLRSHIDTVKLYSSCQIRNNYLLDILEELNNEQIIRITNTKN